MVVMIMFCIVAEFVGRAWDFDIECIDSWDKVVADNFAFGPDNTEV